MASSFMSFVNQFGFWPGIQLHRKSKTKGTQQLKVPDLKHPITIRGKTADRSIFREIFIERQYDIPIPFEPKLIIDGGANIGLFSCLFASKFPQARILAIEPQAQNFQLLEKNTQLYPGVECFQAGLWPNNAELKLKTGDFNEATYELELADSNQNNEHCIRALTIDDITSKYPNQPIDILKLDIEGAEEALFEPSCQSWLDRVRMIIVELHPGHDQPFHQQVTPQEFAISQKGENLICIRK